MDVHHVRGNAVAAWFSLITSTAALLVAGTCMAVKLPVPGQLAAISFELKSVSGLHDQIRHVRCVGAMRPMAPDGIAALLYPLVVPFQCCGQFSAHRRNAVPQVLVQFHASQCSAQKAVVRRARRRERKKGGRPAPVEPGLLTPPPLRWRAAGGLTRNAAICCASSSTSHALPGPAALHQRAGPVPTFLMVDTRYGRRGCLQRYYYG